MSQGIRQPITRSILYPMKKATPSAAMIWVANPAYFNKFLSGIRSDHICRLDRMFNFWS